MSQELEKVSAVNKADIASGTRGIVFDMVVSGVCDVEMCGLKESISWVEWREEKEGVEGGGIRAKIEKIATKSDNDFADSHMLYRIFRVEPLVAKQTPTICLEATFRNPCHSPCFGHRVQERLWGAFEKEGNVGGEWNHPFAVSIREQFAPFLTQPQTDLRRIKRKRCPIKNARLDFSGVVGLRKCIIWWGVGNTTATQESVGSHDFVSSMESEGEGVVEPFVKWVLHRARIT